MPKNFYSLGYNLADNSDLRMTSIKFNNHDYPSEEFDLETFNITSWWTPSMQTQIQVRFKTRLNEIRNDCSLKKDDELFLTLYSYCSGTKLQHLGSTLILDSEDVEIDITIPANEIADELTLHAVITTRFNQKIERKVGAPKLTNSRLITKSWTIKLAGSHTQANVVFLDFSKDPSRAKALWQIRISDSLDLDSWLTAEHSNMLRIEVNKIHEDFIQQPYFQIPLMTDLVMLALDNVFKDDEKINYLQNDSEPEGSWAKFVRHYYKLIFPTGTLSIKQKWIDDQDRIRARVQDLLYKNLEMI